MIAAASVMLVALLACDEHAAARQPRRKLPPTTAVIILKYMYDPDETAAFITDPAVIQQFRESIAENPHAVEHACGYHWLICFRDQSGNVTTYAHNEDCEEYQRHNRRVSSLLKRTFKQIRENPSAYVFNATIPADITPEMLIARTSGRQHHVFFLDGTDSRLPSLHIQVSVKSPIPEDRNEWESAVKANRERALKRLNEAVWAVERATPGIHHSRLENRFSSFGGGEIEDHADTFLYLPYGESPQNLNLPPDIEVLEKTRPAHYSVQVVAPSRSPIAVKRALEKELGVDVAVAPYPKVP